MPLRATLTVALREYKTLDEQLEQLESELAGPHAQLRDPERRHAVAASPRNTTGAPGEWRSIADANGIEDPRRLDGRAPR